MGRLGFRRNSTIPSDAAWLTIAVTHALGLERMKGFSNIDKRQKLISRIVAVPGRLRSGIQLAYLGDMAAQITARSTAARGNEADKGL